MRTSIVLPCTSLSKPPGLLVDGVNDTKHVACSTHDIITPVVEISELARLVAGETSGNSLSCMQVSGDLQCEVRYRDPCLEMHQYNSRHIDTALRVVDRPHQLESTCV